MFIKRNYRLIASEPSPTVTSHCLDEFVHPVYDRALTVRECARLQSFPNGYDFCGAPTWSPTWTETSRTNTNRSETPSRPCWPVPGGRPSSRS